MPLKSLLFFYSIQWVLRNCLLRTEVVEIGYKSSRKKEKRKSGWHIREEHTVKLFSESSQYFDCDLKMLGKLNFENRRHSYYTALTIGPCALIMLFCGCVFATLIILFMVKFFISIFRTIVYNFYNTFKYIRKSGIYYGFLIFFWWIIAKRPPFLFQGRCPSFAAPQKKNLGRFRQGGRTGGKSKGSALLCAPPSRPLP